MRILKVDLRDWVQSGRGDNQMTGNVSLALIKPLVGESFETTDNATHLVRQLEENRTYFQARMKGMA